MEAIENIEYNAGILRNGILGHVLSDAADEVTRHTIRTYGRDDWPVIKRALEEWQGKGYLKILKNPESANDDEVCVKFLTFFEHQSPIPGFLNWE